MIPYLVAWAATTVVMVALDLLWLGLIAKPYYQQSIGHLLASQPKVAAAGLFYAVYPIGLMVFAVAPFRQSIGWTDTAVHAAMFGAFAYATYDLTNLATLRDWPLGLSLLDLAWGTLVSALAATAGKFALDRFASA
jgi:uncharacterized membrane protein